MLVLIGGWHHVLKAFLMSDLRRPIRCPKYGLSFSFIYLFTLEIMSEDDAGGREEGTTISD